MNAAVLFAGEPALAERLAERFDLVATRLAGSVGARRARIALLDRRAFRDLDALLAARAELGVPTLLLVEARDLARAVAAVAPVDDIGRVDDPPALVVHRLERLAHLAGVGALGRDGLTGLADRTTALARLELELSRAAPDEPLSLLLFDIDNFKQVNDAHGHSVGDEVLQAIAERLGEALPDALLLARYGGEEMLALVRADDTDALAAAELTAGLVRARPVTPHQLEVTLSAGVATVREPCALDELVRRADRALYAAKAEGRDRCICFAELERRALREDDDVELVNFENLTRVISERLAGLVARRGRRLFRELKQQADIDALTGLYSRRYLDRRLAFELGEAERSGEALTLAMLDVDHFGQVNKQHGWPSGDRVLSRLAEVVRSRVRDGDWVARYGGEELCLVMPGLDLAHARPVLERVRAAVSSASFISEAGEPLRLTVSIGAATRADDEREMPPLVARASACLLDAKRGGRDRVCC
ncbi:MAG: GGDEF domain-containing protein [Myxococcales bacterium]|nr:GGDEF domain-containing protein [Myxococcales bacterium]